MKTQKNAFFVDLTKTPCLKQQKNDFFFFCSAWNNKNCWKKLESCCQTFFAQFWWGDAFWWHVRFKFWKQEKPYWRANKSRSILHFYQKQRFPNISFLWIQFFFLRSHVVHHHGCLLVYRKLRITKDYLVVRF